MKKLILLICTNLFLASFFMTAFGQTGRESGTKYGLGQDSMDCVLNHQTYRAEVRNRKYSAALPTWRKVYAACPAATKYVVVDGANIFLDLIAKEKDEAKKAAYVDTLVDIYKTRLELYPADEITVKGYMGMDLYSHHPRKDVNMRKDIRSSLDVFLNDKKDKATAREISAYFSTLVELYTEGEATADEVFASYDKYNKLVETKLAEKPDDEDFTVLKTRINGLLIASGVADCENIIKIFTPQVEANPDNLELLKRVQSMLYRNNCMESDETAALLFKQVTEKLIKMEPSAQASYGMAKLYMREKNYAKALEYIDSAIEMETVDENKGEYFFQKALINHGELSKTVDAVRFAKEAVKYKKNWGEPYLFIGTLYAQSAPSLFKGSEMADQVKRGAVYWAAVDKFMQAKAVDPSVAGKANDLIRTYSAHFPSSEHAFFLQLKAGDNYTVEGWINEVTKVRF